MKKYTTADISSELGISERTIRRWITDLVDISKGKYRVSEEVFLLLKNKTNTDSLGTTSGQYSDSENDEFPHVEYFTSNEYEEFKKRITEYPFLKEQIESSKQHLEAMEKQIEYFRFSYNKQLEIHEKLIDSFRERNYIEAKEKGFDS